MEFAEHNIGLRPKLPGVFKGKETAVCVRPCAGLVGNVEHGAQYQLKLVYEHHLQRTACNMTYGTFGGVTGTRQTLLGARRDTHIHTHAHIQTGITRTHKHRRTYTL